MNNKLPPKELINSHFRAPAKLPSSSKNSLSSRSLMEPRTGNPQMVANKIQYSVQETSFNRAPSTDRTLDQELDSKKGSISSKINFVRRDEYPTEIVKEKEFNSAKIRKHQVKKIFTNAAGRSLSPTERQVASVEHGEYIYSNLNSPRKERKTTITSKQYLDILFRKNETEKMAKMEAIELDEKIKVALEKESGPDFIQFQQVKINRFLETLNNQEALQNLLLTDDYENYKKSLLKIINDFILFVSKSSEGRLIKMVGEGTSSEDLRKICNFMRVFSEFHKFQQKGEELFGKNKPEREEYVVSNHAFKVFLKGEKKFRLFYDAISDLEQILEESLEKTKTLNARIQVLEEENKNIAELLKNTMGNFSEEAMKFVKTSLKKYESLSLDYKHLESNQSIEEFFKQAMAGLERENTDLRGDIELLAKSEAALKEIEKIYSLKTLKGTIRKLEKQIRSFNKPKADKQVECNSVDVNALNKKKVPLSQLILEPSEGTAGVVQSKAWTMTVINLILSDKIQTDIYDEQDKRVKVSLQRFASAWFLKTFSSRNLAEGMLKDFTRSLKEYCPISERFKIFCNLLGLNFSYQEEKFDSESKLNRERVKRVYFSSGEGLQIYLNICYYLKSGDKLLPNLLVQGEDFIEVGTAWEKMQLIFSENGIKSEKELEQEFRMIVQSDIYYRITDQISTERSTKKLQGPEDNYIRFDYLCRFLMEYIFKRKTSSLENIYIALRLNNTTDSGILLEDFARVCRKYIENLSPRWIEGAFADFLDEEEQENFVGLAINRIVPWIINDKIYKERPYMSKISDEFKINKREKEKIMPGAQKPVVQENNASQVVLYDSHTLLTFIRETYEMAKNFINQKERISEALKNLHFAYKKDFDEIAAKLAEDQQSKKSLTNTEFIKSLDNLWVLKSNNGKDSLKSKVMVPAFSFSSEDENNENQSTSSPNGNLIRENFHAAVESSQTKKQRNAVLPALELVRLNNRRRHYKEIMSSHSKQLSVDFRDKRRNKTRRRSFEQTPRESSILSAESPDNIADNIKTLPSAAKKIIAIKRKKRKVAKSCQCSKCGEKTAIQKRIEILHSGVIKQQVKTAQLELLKKVVTRMIYRYRRRKTLQKRSTNKIKKAMRGNLNRSPSKKYEKLPNNLSSLANQHSPPLNVMLHSPTKNIKMMDSAYCLFNSGSNHEEEVKPIEIRLSQTRKLTRDIDSQGASTEKMTVDENTILRSNSGKTENITTPVGNRKLTVTIEKEKKSPRRLEINKSMSDNSVFIKRVFKIKNTDELTKFEPLNSRRLRNAKSPKDFNLPNLSLVNRCLSGSYIKDTPSPKSISEYYIPVQSKSKISEPERKRMLFQKASSPYLITCAYPKLPAFEGSFSRVPKQSETKKDSAQASFLSRSNDLGKEERYFRLSKAHALYKEEAKKVANHSHSPRSLVRNADNSKLNSPQSRSTINFKHVISAITDPLKF